MRKQTAVVTVASVSPLRVVFPGSAQPVAAKNYGLALAVGQKVQVTLGPAPTAPTVSSILRAAPPATGGATLLNIVDLAEAFVSFDIADVVTANLAGDLFTPSGWALAAGDPTIFAVPDDGGLTVDFANYKGGSGVIVEGFLGPSGSPVTDKFLNVYAQNHLQGVSLCAPVFPTLDNTSMTVDWAFQSTALSLEAQTSAGYAVPLPFSLAVSDPSATVTSGDCVLVVKLSAYVPGVLYADLV